MLEQIQRQLELENYLLFKKLSGLRLENNQIVTELGRRLWIAQSKKGRYYPLVFFLFVRVSNEIEGIIDTTQFTNVAPQ